jgi:hypothetical protein
MSPLLADQSNQIQIDMSDCQNIQLIDRELNWSAESSCALIQHREGKNSSSSFVDKIHLLVLMGEANGFK